MEAVVECSDSCSKCTCSNCNKLKQPVVSHMGSCKVLCRHCSVSIHFCQACGSLVGRGTKLCRRCNKIIKHGLVPTTTKCFVCKETKEGCVLTIKDQRVCPECYPRHKEYICSESERHTGVHSYCQLNNKCCFCSDQRAYIPEGMYSGYLDTIGYVMNKNRWDFYCPPCKKYFERDF